MNKLIILSLVTATVLFTACGEKEKKSATEATTHAVEVTKEAAAKAVETAKEATAKAVEATKEAAKVAETAAENAVKKVEAATTGSTETQTADAAILKEGATLFAKCKGCHGVDGKTKALGKSALLSGLSKDAVVEMLNAYKAGTRNEVGMGMLMKGQVASMDDKAIEALATYIATLK